MTTLIDGAPAYPPRPRRAMLITLALSVVHLLLGLSAANNAMPGDIFQASPLIGHALTNSAPAHAPLARAWDTSQGAKLAGQRQPDATPDHPEIAVVPHRFGEETLARESVSPVPLVDVPAGGAAGIPLSRAPPA